MASHSLVSGLPRVFLSLPCSFAPPSAPCDACRLRASLRPASAPFQTLHLNVWGTRGSRVKCLHSDRGGEFRSGILAGFCGEEGIIQSWTLLESPQQNGLLSAALAWSWTSLPRVSQTEVSPTRLWTGSPGVGSVFRVWGCLALVRDTSTDKISARAIPCVFLDFPVGSPDYSFYHPPLHQFLDSCDVRFDVSVSYYTSQGLPVPPPPLFLAPSPPPALTPQVPPPHPGPASSGGVGAGGAAAGGTWAKGARLRGVGAGGAGTGGASSGGVGAGGAGTGGASSGGVGAGGTGTGGASSGVVALRRRELAAHPHPATTYVSRLFAVFRARSMSAWSRRGSSCDSWTGRKSRRNSISSSHRSSSSSSRNSSRSLRALGLPSPPPVHPQSLPTYGPTFPPPNSSSAVFPPPQSHSPPPVVPLNWTARCPPRARPSSPLADLRTALFCFSPRHTPPESVLPSPPTSSLTVSSHLISNNYRTAHPVVSLVLASLVTDPRASPSFVSALTAAVTDFASTRRLDFATRVVAAPPARPEAAEGRFALGCDVLEDKQFELEFLAAASSSLCAMLISPEGDPDALDIPTPCTYHEAVPGEWASHWKAAMDSELASWRSTGTYVDEVPPPRANIVDGIWLFKVKRPPGSPPVFKARYVARGFRQREGVDFFQTFVPTPKMTTLRVLLHIAAHRDYELHSLDFSTAFLQGRLHEDIWCHNTLRSLLRDLGFRPSSAHPSLFVCTGSTPFFILVYVNNLVFAPANRAALVEVLRRFGFQFSTTQPTPLAIDHRLTAPFPDEPFESSGPYAELVVCLMYLMTCTRPDLAFPLSILSHFVATGRHRPIHWTAAVRVAKYLATTSGMGLVLGGTQPVELTGHCDFVASEANTADVFTKALVPGDNHCRAAPPTEPRRPLSRTALPSRAAPLSRTALHYPTTSADTAATAAIAVNAATTAPTAALASPTVLTFDAEGRAVDFDVWVDDLKLFLQCDSRDGQPRSRETPSAQQLREWYAGRGRSGGAGPCTYVLPTGSRPGEACGLPHTTQRCFGHWTDAWHTQFPDAVELPRWHDLLLQNVPIFDLDFDAIVAAMYALSDSAEGDCYLSVPPDPGIATAALGASASAAPGTGESAAPGVGDSALSGTAPTEALHTFTLDSSASRSFSRDSTTLISLSRPVAVSLADPSGDPVLAHSSTVLPCPAAPSGLLSGLHLPSFSTNFRVTHCTCSRTGRHLATFTHRPGSSLYTLTTAPPPVFASGQVAASSQVVAAASRSSPAAAPYACRPLSHETLLWHHRLGHPSLPRLRGMASHTLRAAPHSSTFPPTKAPLQTLHMGVWGPARVRGQGHERYFLLVVDDYSRYTTVFPLRSKGEVPKVLIDWICGARRQLSECFGSDLPVLRLHSDRGGEFSSDLLRAFCRAEGIRQTFTLPASP
ncbi:unnamed protein product [Closterium sp. NIES-54]